MTRKRKLRAEEVELWGQVAKTTTPLGKPRSTPAARPAPKSPSPKSAPEHPQQIPEFRVGETARQDRLPHSLAPSLSASLAADPIAMDKKAFTRLKRGKLKPEARLDLHGMTLDRAYPALIGFIQRAAARDLRLVLVITGKGKHKPDEGPIPQRMGVLRHQVPQWLRMPPLGPLVMQISEAHLRHGGGGAYYVYLRRRR
ncbi:Smr/MutS family protein [Phaeobacter sp. J2-8]|uniref:Smr/MutS family protein n=1 Tax=Phaeobacter sp. J2-8 TaxID=2931394 RepID=UPI001FD0DF76|nr:Smr/MutS family protein [Phaeobacter sp. J2-8]MCJ7870997.1 Smr/MutS family protein [Phaeobacter sp. J2-8]